MATGGGCFVMQEQSRFVGYLLLSQLAELMATSSIQRSSSQGENKSSWTFAAFCFFCIILLISTIQRPEIYMRLPKSRHIISLVLFSPSYHNSNVLSISNLLNTTMKLQTLLGIVLSLSAFECIRLKVSVDQSQGPVCFFQNLRNQLITTEQDEKYLYKVTADTPNFRMEVMINDPSQPSWKEVAVKKSTRYSEQINKISQSAGTYNFCLFSLLEDRPLYATLEIQTKLELANFEYLPSLDDHQNMDNQIEWMLRQKENMFQVLSRIEGMRTSSEQVKSMMGVTMVVVAILGVVVIAAANVAFYLLARKTLQERKLI